MIVDVILILQVFNLDDGTDFIVLSDVDQVLYWPALCSLRSFWNRIRFQPEQLSFVGEYQEVVVRRSGKQVFCPIVLFGAHSFGTNSSPTLGTVFGQGCSLHVSLMGNGNDHFLIRDHVLVTEIFCIVLNLGTTIIRIALFHFLKLSFDDLHSLAFITKNSLKFFDKRHDFFVLSNDLVALHACKALKSHVKNRSSLDFTQFKTLHQPISGSFWIQ